MPCPYQLIVGTRYCRVLGLYHSEANGFDITRQSKTWREAEEFDESRGMIFGIKINLQA